jgi:hypothetical protein
MEPSDKMSALKLAALGLKKVKEDAEVRLLSVERCCCRGWISPVPALALYMGLISYLFHPPSPPTTAVCLRWRLERPTVQVATARPRRAPVAAVGRTIYDRSLELRRLVFESYVGRRCPAAKAEAANVFQLHVLWLRLGRFVWQFECLLGLR